MRRALITLGLMGALALPVLAQAPPGPSEGNLHQRLLALAIENLGKARCGQVLCAPATPEERANPPLTEEQARAIVTTGTVSVTAEHCGLDWQRRNFVPMMRHHREGLRMNERQMALVGLLHGITMGTLEGQVRQGPCTPEMRQMVEKRLIGQ